MPFRSFFGKGYGGEAFLKKAASPVITLYYFIFFIFLSYIERLR